MPAGPGGTGAGGAAGVREGVGRQRENDPGAAMR